MTPGGAVLIGLAAGGVCYAATLLRERMKVDDALDVFAVHGAGGVFGAIATGIFASVALVQQQYYMALALAALGGATAGFLAWNLPPARIFLGDAGALVLGHALGSLTLLESYVTATGPATSPPCCRSS